VSRIPLIIDCDPGVDDATALFLAFASPELDLLGITTVAGNVDVARTARNARIIRQIAGREDVPVYAGCELPLLRAPVQAGHFHGESGLGTIEVFEPEAPTANGHAVHFIVETVMSRPEGSVTLAITGPMTNVAMAMRLEPKLAKRLGPVVAMGGARSEAGNITASAEFNVYADPHAAEIVFASGCKITVMDLDVTHQARASSQRIEAVRAVDTPAARTVAELLTFSQGVEIDLVGGDAPPLHDPCTIAWLLRPELFVTRPCTVAVETGSALSLGHTAVEFRVNRATANVEWATKVDADGLFALLCERLAG
jgi:purine nucleosidase